MLSLSPLQYIAIHPNPPYIKLMSNIFSMLLNIIWIIEYCKNTRAKRGKKNLKFILRTNHSHLDVTLAINYLFPVTGILIMVAPFLIVVSISLSYFGILGILYRIDLKSDPQLSVFMAGMEFVACRIGCLFVI